MIKHVSLDHNWFYCYRIHSLKSSSLCKEFSNLTNYLEEMFKNCPNHYFKNKISSSKLNFNLNLSLHHIKGHEICDLAREALKLDISKTDHTKIQVYFLEKDNKTIASEIPVWIEPEELNYKELNIKEPLTGHIDLIRIEENNIWVWDYKPYADKERYAPTQLYFYALMLSKRTGIPIERFRCGYFDENNAFIFRPKLEQVL